MEIKKKVEDLASTNPAPNVAKEAIQKLIKNWGIKMHHAFPKEFAESINVRVQLKSTQNDEVYNDSKKPTSPKIALAQEIYGFELYRKIMGMFDEEPPVYPSKWTREWRPATKEEQEVWDDHAEAIAEVVKIIKKKCPTYKLSGERLYVLHEAVQARVRMAGDAYNIDVSVEDVRPNMIGVGVSYEGMVITGSIGYPKAPTSPCKMWVPASKAELDVIKDAKDSIYEAIAIMQKTFPDFWQGEGEKDFQIYVCKQVFSCDE